MVSDRPYRSAMTQAEALAEVRRCAGTQFDPSVAEAFCESVVVGLAGEDLVRSVQLLEQDDPR
jgi:HD-GYP domain-containing protein (c-di-GMP phosphodiesterase class II)